MVELEDSELMTWYEWIVQWVFGSKLLCLVQGLYAHISRCV